MLLSTISLHSSLAQALPARPQKFCRTWYQKQALYAYQEHGRQ